MQSYVWHQSSRKSHDVRHRNGRVSILTIRNKVAIRLCRRMNPRPRDGSFVLFRLNMSQDQRQVFFLMISMWHAQVRRASTRLRHAHDLVADHNNGESQIGSVVSRQRILVASVGMVGLDCTEKTQSLSRDSRCRNCNSEYKANVPSESEAGDESIKGHRPQQITD